MPAGSHPKTVGFLTRFLSRLKFPWLFTLFAFLFGLNLVVPDFVPFIDELLLGLMTLLFGAWKDRKALAKADRERTESPVDPATVRH